jgi:hypothetical protein
MEQRVHDRNERRHDEPPFDENARDERARADAMDQETAGDSVEARPPAAGTVDDDRMDDDGERVRREGPYGTAETGRGDADTADAPPPAADEQLTVPEDRDAAAAAEGRSAGAPPSNDGRPFELFPGAEREDYRRRWDTLQAAFVDDPRGSTEQADALLGELVVQVTGRHQELREELASQSGDTEAMRQALRQYRAFFIALVG